MALNNDIIKMYLFADWSDQKIMKKVICILICTLFVLPLSACSSPGIFGSKNKMYKEDFMTMDTSMELSASGPNAQKAVEESKKKLFELNDMASSTIKTSDVSKINDAAGKEYVKVHPEIIKMILASQKYSDITNGEYDLTVGPIINLWGIGTDKERIPEGSEIKAKLPLVGYKKISVNQEDSSVMLKDPGMAIDLGGVAKGFAADEVLKIYKKYNIENGLINLGSSSMYAVGKNEDNGDWKIGIKHPRSEASDNLLGILSISNQGISTSGDYERYFVKNGRRYFHIMNPKTGYPVNNGIMSATVVVDESIPDANMTADILSLVIFELGPEKGIKLINSMPKVSCEVTMTDYTIYTSNGFKDKMSDLNKDFKYKDLPGK
ncbi:FAD:protein FMN transferase [Clostridium sp. JN-1]|uniref:FAD:protein FMN transferase n=1 Tax=Clostridium sp. JN-1 TaxID=2483110 RepID=UPI00325A8344